MGVEVYRSNLGVRNLRQFFEKNTVISPPGCRTTNRPKALSPNSLIKPQQPVQSATAKLLPSDAIQTLWLTLSADGQCPVVNNLSDLEKAISKLLRSTQGLTVGLLKQSLKSPEINQQWADKFLNSPSLKYFLEADGLKFYIGTMARRFAQELINSLPAGSRPIAERHIEKKENLQNQPKKTTDTKNIPAQKKTAPVKRAAEKPVVKNKTKETVYPAKPSTTITPTQKTKPAPKDELSTLAGLLGVKRPEAKNSSTRDSLEETIRTMLDHSKVTMAAFEKGLNRLASNNVWAVSCLNDNQLTQKFGFSGNPSDYTYSISSVLAKHILSPAAPANNNKKVREIPKKPTPVVDVKITTDAKIQPAKSKQATATETLKPAPVTKEARKPETRHFRVEKKAAPVVKKTWGNNREDKRLNGKPFTSVQFETVDGKLLNAELLNLVPDEVLKANGWSKAEIDRLKTGNRRTPLSNAALKALNFDGNITHRNGRFYGEGSFGLVKFARIQLTDAQNARWCVAKKITSNLFVNQAGKLEEDVKYEDVMREARLQSKSGCAPLVYGVADTYKKQKGRKKEHQYIVFMEQAKGIDGDRFLKQNPLMPAQDKLVLAKNTASAISTMHSNNIYHGDIKANNLSVDSKTLKVRLLDFGAAVEGKQQSKFDLHSYGPLYLPPELVKNSYSQPVSIDREKADVYSLGVFIGEIFSNGQLFAHNRDANWPASSLRHAQSMINNRLRRINITHPEIASLVREMVSADHRTRPNMAEVNQRLSRIMAQKPKQQQRFSRERNYPENKNKVKTPVSETVSKNLGMASSGVNTRNEALNKTLSALYANIGGKEIKSFENAMTVLELDYETATLNLATKAYRKKMLRLHPDKFRPVNLEGLGEEQKQIEMTRQKAQAQEFMHLTKNALNRMEEDLS